jgi:mono/diheme cytochrome c family protein
MWRIAVLSVVLAYAAPAMSADYVSMSGQNLYRRFCASCHGVQGRGDGPVAASLKVEVPDLSRIARRGGDLYPRDRIMRIIDGRFIVGAHGTRTMPIWGEDLSRLEIGNPDAERATQVVLDKLADYVWQLQKPARPDPVKE